MAGTAVWRMVTMGVALAVFLAFLAATEAMIRVLIEPEDHFEQHIGVFYRSNSGNTVFGDSIPANGMILDRSDFVNLASVSETPRQMLIKMRHYYARRRPGQVVIGANVNLLARNPALTFDYERIFGMPQRPLLRILEPHKRRLAGKYWQVLLLKGEFRSKFRVLRYGGLVLTHPERYGAFARLSDDARRDLARQELLSNVPRPEWRNENVEYLRRSLRFLTERAARVCLVTFPKSPAYRALASEVEEVAGVRSMFRRIAPPGGGCLRGSVELDGSNRALPKRRSPD